MRIKSLFTWLFALSLWNKAINVGDNGLASDRRLILETYSAGILVKKTTKIRINFANVKCIYLSLVQFERLSSLIPRSKQVTNYKRSNSNLSISQMLLAEDLAHTFASTTQRLENTCRQILWPQATLYFQL